MASWPVGLLWWGRIQCGFSGVPWKRCPQGTQPKHTVKPLDLICIANLPHLLYWKNPATETWPFFFFFSLHNLLTEAGRDSSPPAKQVRGVNENCRHHSTSPHPFHPLLWVVLASDGWPYCHSKSSSWTELARSIVAIKWTIRFQSTGKRSNGSDVETLSVTHSLPKLCEALLAPFFLRKKKSMCRCPPNCCTALDGALHKSLIRPLISTKLSHWF